MDRIKTGIPGYDTIIQGGYIPKSVNLVSGGAGTGKTIFGLQFIWNGVTRFLEPGLYVSFEENIRDLEADALAMGWDFSKYPKKLKCIYHAPYEIENFVDRLEKEINQLKAKRVVIDSTSTFGMALKDDYEVRRKLYELIAALKKIDCVSILTSEIIGGGDVSGAGSLSRFGVEEFVSDSVTLLYFAGLGGHSDRTLRVIKSREINQKKGLFPMEITSKGIVVHVKKDMYE
ncbi:MAG: AAA family ATPase [Candidatus Woesearchaeota archaeon]|nr:MAG: AAA family ATPase [Candidatus Woesearchaeota archaeon]